jgi:2-(1,2-epoxy-1,2-dihydrophenyl)acetyl-CoA isomerase
MTRQTVLLTFDGPIATLTLNRPETLNSISNQLVIDARDALADVRATQSARVLILTGAGRGFCTGAELGEAIVKGDGTQSAGDSLNAAMRDHSNPLIVDLQQLPIPVVAAVNGVAVGAGVGIALAADITIAARSASFILTFGLKLGVIPDLGTTWQLPRRIGVARAMALALLGNKLGAEQAAQWGLIWQCVDDDQLAATAL